MRTEKTTSKISAKIVERCYRMSVEKVLKTNEEYLKSREKETICDEHGLLRYYNGVFQGCFLCYQDRKIQDNLMKANILEFIRSG